MTILLLAHNEKENVIKVIEHFRKLRINGFDFSLILVDNGSTDDLKDWAKDQNDFIYTNYQNMVPWSFAIAASSHGTTRPATRVHGTNSAAMTPSLSTSQTAPKTRLT